MTYKQPQPQKESCKSYAKTLLTKLLFRQKMNLKADILFYGRFAHSQEFLASLDKKICYVDDDFQLNHYRYCRSAGIPYCALADSRKKQHLKNPVPYGKLLTAVQNFLKEGYDSQDLSWAAKNYTDWLKPYVREAFLQSAAVEKLFAVTRAGVMIVDEDWQVLKRSAAITFKHFGGEVYMLSHGVPARNFKISDKMPKTNIAKIFVQSEFEKDKYEIFGAAREDIEITGLPRYDHILRHLKTIPAAGNEKKTVLYCSHPFDREVSRKFGINTTPEIAIAHCESLLKACADLDVFLRIKLHYDTDEFRLWNEMIASCGNPELVELCDHSHNIYQLISAADILVTTFSTAAIEAMMLDTPVMILNFSGAKDVHPFVERGVAAGAYRSDQLKSTLQQCLFDSAFQSNLKNKAAGQKNYFCGNLDGHGYTAVADKIKTTMGVSHE